MAIMAMNPMDFLTFGSIMVRAVIVPMIWIRTQIAMTRHSVSNGPFGTST